MQRRFVRLHGASMVDGQAHRQFLDVALKWRDLVERRRAYFAELYHSGRWKRYYTEHDFVMRMREVAATAEMWTKVAPRAGDDDDQPHPAVDAARRSAA